MLQIPKDSYCGKRSIDSFRPNDVDQPVKKLKLPSSINYVRNTSDTVVDTVHSFMKEERLTKEFTDYYFTLLEKRDSMEKEPNNEKKKELKKEYMNECAWLVMGYFNQYLNGKKVVFGASAIVDDSKMMWHAKLINNGGFGTVLKVTKRNEHTGEIDGVRAIKVVPRNNMGLCEGMKSAQLASNYVVKVFNVFVIRQMSCIEMEFLEEGSLQGLIYKKTPLPRSIICKMLHQCSEVLSRMKKLNMVHSDIKPDNIMIQNKQFDIAVGDFGLSLDKQLLVEPTRGGTKGYIAPEVLNGVESSFESDLFSLGVTFENLLACIIEKEEVEDENEQNLKLISKQLQSNTPNERVEAFYRFNAQWILQTKTMSHAWENDVELISTMLKHCGFVTDTFWAIRRLEEFIGFRVNIGESVKRNLDFITEFNLFKIAHPSLYEDRRFLLNAAKARFLIETELPDDRDLVFEMVKVNGNQLEFANKTLRADRELVLEAIKERHFAFDYVVEHLKEDRDFVLAAVSQNGNVLTCLSKQFLQDKEVVLKAINQYGYLLFRADESFRSDREMMLTALKNMKSGDFNYFLERDDKFLDMIDESQRMDSEIILELLSKRGLELEFVADKFKSDKQMVLAAVKQNGVALQYAIPDFRKDEEIVLAAVKSNPIAFRHSLVQTSEIVLEVVKKFSGVSIIFRNLDVKFRSDKNIVLAAVEQDGNLLEYVDESLKSDEEIVRAANRQIEQERLTLQSMFKIN